MKKDTFDKLKARRHSKPAEPVNFRPTKEDAATSIRTLNDPKVRAAFSKDWGEMWSHFIADENNNRWWGARCRRDEPNYCLPIEFIRTLSAKGVPLRAATRYQTGRNVRRISKPAMIDSDDAMAETAFREICQRFSSSCVGEWNGRPVTHELLGPTTSYDAFPDNLLMKATFLKGTLAQRKAALQKFDPIGNRIQRILRHRAGQLFAETKFVEELRDLRIAWTAQRSTIPFPLTRHVIDQVQGEQAEEPIAPETRAFFTQVRTFLNRWELLSLTTWDLITPLGPITGLPVKVSLNALGDIYISNVYPSYWPATGKEEHLFARLQSSTPVGMEAIQERLLPNPSIFERAYELRIIEHAFIIRYAPAPHGYIERLIQAFQVRFDVFSRLQIQLIRKKYEATLTRAKSSVPKSV